MEKIFDINRSGCSIRSILYCADPLHIDTVVIACHGFAGDMHSSTIRRFAQRLLPTRKKTAVLSFCWPCHGEDSRHKITLADCDRYLTAVIDYAHEVMGATALYAMGTSFGGYLILKYVQEHGNPFVKICLRCPATGMYDTLSTTLLKPEDHAKLAKGKDVTVGFDRLIKISPAFLNELRENDIRKLDFSPLRDALLILHGTKDEVVPIAVNRTFCEEKGIDFIEIEGGDHRFQHPVALSEMLDYTVEYLAIP